MPGNYGRKYALLIIFGIIYHKIIMMEKYNDNIKKYFSPKFFNYPH